MLTDETRLDPFHNRPPDSPSYSDEAVETMARGEEILDQVKQVARAIEERVHQVIGTVRDEWTGEKFRPGAAGG